MQVTMSSNQSALCVTLASFSTKNSWWSSTSTWWLTSRSTTSGDWRTCGTFLDPRSPPILCPPLFGIQTGIDRCSPVYRLPLLHHFSKFRTQQRDSSKGSVREIIHQHCVTYTGCLFSMLSATNYVFWCSLYIPATVHLTCLISLLLPQISLPECVSDLSGLIQLWTTDNSAEIWWTLFSHAGPKAWNSLPHAIQEITDCNIFKCKMKTFLFKHASSTLW